jgi:hypothetical protein
MVEEHYILSTMLSALVAISYLVSGRLRGDGTEGLDVCIVCVHRRQR